MDCKLFGCTLEALSRFADDRGWLVPVWSADERPAQYMYYSWTYPGCCRDADQWHIHQIQTDHFTCAYGNLLVALSDGKTIEHVALQYRNPMLLSIPPGVYHCFKNYWHRDSLLVNLPSHVYNPEDEGRVLFEDLEVERPW